MRLALFFVLISISWGSVGDAAPQKIVFERRLAQPGDTSVQELICDLDLQMSIRQGSQVVQAQRQLLKRKQNRRLTILQAAANAPKKARVTYDKSVITVLSPEQQSSSAQPVTGKSYLITRQADQLTITNPDGSEPSEAELAIVTGNMGSFGLPNPIAEFFHGKSVTVGQQLELPVELARDLVGFAETGNTVSSFEMKLLRVELGEGRRSQVAVFTIQLLADDPDASGVSMKLAGEMKMEVATCRATSVQLTGAVSAFEDQGPPQGRFRMHSEGEIQVAVRAEHQQR